MPPSTPKRAARNPYTRPLTPLAKLELRYLQLEERVRTLEAAILGLSDMTNRHLLSGGHLEQSPFSPWYPPRPTPPI